MINIIVKIRANGLLSRLIHEKLRGKGLNRNEYQFQFNEAKRLFFLFVNKPDLKEKEVKRWFGEHVRGERYI